MSKDLTVENMFTEKHYEVTHLVSGYTLGALQRKRMLEHVIADVTSTILSQPGSNPVGLTITVQLHPNTDGAPMDLMVTATAPQYELDPAFFV